MPLCFVASGAVECFVGADALDDRDCHAMLACQCAPRLARPLEGCHAIEDCRLPAPQLLFGKRSQQLVCGPAEIGVGPDPGAPQGRFELISGAERAAEDSHRLIRGVDLPVPGKPVETINCGHVLIARSLQAEPVHVHTKGCGMGFVRALGLRQAADTIATRDSEGGNVPREPWHPANF
jgi:hypothetical protein